MARARALVRACTHAQRACISGPVGASPAQGARHNLQLRRLRALEREQKLVAGELPASVSSQSQELFVCPAEAMGRASDLDRVPPRSFSGVAAGVAHAQKWATLMEQCEEGLARLVGKLDLRGRNGRLLSSVSDLGERAAELRKAEAALAAAKSAKTQWLSIVRQLVRRC